MFAIVLVSGNSVSRDFLSIFSISTLSTISWVDNKEEAERKFQDISEANEVLSDPELKAKYDRGEPVFENQGGGGGQGGFNPHQFFRQGGFQGGGGRHHFHFSF